MQGVDTALFPLCHGNNTKPNCPPILPVNLHLFCFPFSPLSLSGMYCQLSRGAFKSLPASFTSPWNQLHYAGPFSVPTYRGKDGPGLGIYSPRWRPQSHLQHSFSSPQDPCYPRTPTAVASSYCSWSFSWRCQKRLFFFFRQQTSTALRDTLCAAGCLPLSCTVLSELSPHPWLSAALLLKAYPQVTAELLAQWALTTFPLYAARAASTTSSTSSTSAGTFCCHYLRLTPTSRSAPVVQRWVVFFIGLCRTRLAIQSTCCSKQSTAAFYSAEPWRDACLDRDGAASLVFWRHIWCFCNTVKHHFFTPHPRPPRPPARPPFCMMLEGPSWTRSQAVFLFNLDKRSSVFLSIFTPCAQEYWRP